MGTAILLLLATCQQGVLPPSALLGDATSLHRPSDQPRYLQPSYPYRVPYDRTTCSPSRSRYLQVRMARREKEIADLARFRERQRAATAMRKGTAG